MPLPVIRRSSVVDYIESSVGTNQKQNLYTGFGDSALPLWVGTKVFSAPAVGAGGTDAEKLFAKQTALR